MSDPNSGDRRSAWTPPQRPEWVQRINEEGRCMNIRSIVPLDEDSLIKAAKANTGLSDFGDDNWYEPFKVLIKALNEESNLNLMGRLITRSDLLIYLEARLRIEDTYRQHPEIEEQEIRSPIFIIGQGRSGTSELHNLLAQDPDNGVMLNWEVMFPCPPPEKASYHSDPRIDKVTQLQEQYYRITPEMRAIHKYGGAAPCENVHMHCLSFRSPAYFMSHLGQCPSYTAYMRTQDGSLQFQYEKRVLKLLQWKNPRERWVFKSPYAMVEIPSVLKVYPDVRFVLTHRDPIKSVASIVNLLGVLTFIRTDTPFLGGSVEQFTDPKLAAGVWTRFIGWLEDGTLPADQLFNVQFGDFISDPMASAEAIYGHYGIPMTTGGRAAIQKYIDARQRANRPEHRYDAGSSERISEERQLFRKYQEYFSVPSEI